ncbi:MAG: HU family DNA-binding protein [Chloroflexi bacterium]|nr:HU family DNA-binding protein [Chloroflexota bacterium]
MASRIKAIGALRPRITLGKTVQKPELVRQMARATGLNEGSMDLTLKELRDTLIENLRAGRSVKVEGLGTWTPNVGLDGTFDVQYRADTALNSGLNVEGIFTGDITNRENIGKTGDELIVRWNELNPGDQVSTD